MLKYWQTVFLFSSLTTEIFLQLIQNVNRLNAETTIFLIEDQKSLKYDSGTLRTLRVILAISAVGAAIVPNGR